MKISLERLLVESCKLQDHRQQSCVCTCMYVRYTRYEGVVDSGAASIRWSVVPTPVEMSVDATRRTVNVQNDRWVIVQPTSQQLNNEAQYLSGMHSLAAVT